MTIEDTENLYLLNLDLDVIKYTGDEPFKNIDEAKTFLKNYDHYQKFNFGRWAVINKIDNDFLGWCGLKYTQDVDEVDIGFRFFKKHWQKGYATEAAKACIDIAFNKFKISTVVGRAMNDNLASIKVLEKIGLKYYKPFSFDEEEGVIYKIEMNGK